MQCMEVWGGNQSADSGVVMAGLDAWVYSRPFGESDSGGDVYYVSSCATGRITRLLVADVSGHGAGVSDVAIQLRTLMRKHVNQINQSKFVRSMNEQFAVLSKAGCFATAVVTTFFSPTNELSLCNAGHPPPLLYRGTKKTWELLEQRDCDRIELNVPLGVVDLAGYDQLDVRLKVGDLVLCYTDSLMESRDETGAMLGTKGLLNIVNTVDVSDATQIVPRLLAAIAAKNPQNLAEDDVTVLLFRPNGLAPIPPLKDRLLAPIRIVKSFLNSLKPGGESPAWPELSIANIGGAILSPLNRFKLRGRKKTADM